jgi:hypothetical protein
MRDYGIVQSLVEVASLGLNVGVRLQDVPMLAQMLGVTLDEEPFDLALGSGEVEEPHDAAD